MDTSSGLRNAILNGTVLVTAWIAPLSTASADVIISPHPTKNMSCAVGVCTPTAKSAVLNVTDLTNMLQTGNLTVATSAKAPDIIVSAPFSWVSANSLTLQGTHSVEVLKPLSDSGDGAIIIVARTGTLSFGPNGHIGFLGLNNPLTINGKSFQLVNSLQMLADAVHNNPSGNYALSQTYDAKPDGTYAHSPIATPFDGTFEGLGNTIQHLTVTSSNQDGGSGLFHQTTTNAWIGDLRIEAEIVSGISISGGLVDDNAGTVWQVAIPRILLTVTGVGGYCIGGAIAGVNEGSIAYSHVDSGVVSDDSKTCLPGVLGMLAGVNGGAVVHDYAIADVQDGTTNGEAGGLIGENNAVIHYSFSAGNVLAGRYGGGLAGANYSNGRIISSFANAITKTGNGGSAGGLVGQNNSTGSTPIDSCTAGGKVKGGTFSYVGGVVGENVLGNVSNCASYTHEAGGTNSYLGGFVGFDHHPNSDMFSDAWSLSMSGITDTRQGAGNLYNDFDITGF